MEIKRIDTDERMSSIVIHNNTIYLCGQVAKDENDDIIGQTTTMLESVDELLESVGSDRKKILSATIYLKDMNLFSQMNSVWDKWVPAGHAPARATVEAKLAAPEYLIEISIVAAL